MKIAVKKVKFCADCPFSTVNWDHGYRVCEKLDTPVDDYDIHKDCPLEDELLTDDEINKIYAEVMVTTPRPFDEILTFARAVVEFEKFKESHRRIK